LNEEEWAVDGIEFLRHAVGTFCITKAKGRQQHSRTIQMRWNS